LILKEPTMNRLTLNSFPELKTASGLELLQLSAMSNASMKARVQNELDRRATRPTNSRSLTLTARPANAGLRTVSSSLLSLTSR